MSYVKHFIIWDYLFTYYNVYFTCEFDLYIRLFFILSLQIFISYFKLPILHTKYQLSRLPISANVSITFKLIENYII